MYSLPFFLDLARNAALSHMFACSCTCMWLVPSIGMSSLSLSPTLWLHSLLGVFAWLVLPWFDLRFFYLCLPRLALPPSWNCFLYFLWLLSSDGMILLPSPKCGLVCFLALFFRARRKGLTSHSLSALRGSRSKSSGQSPAIGKGSCEWLQGPCTVH